MAENEEYNQRKIREGNQIEDLIARPGWKEVLEPWLVKREVEAINKLIDKENSETRGTIKAYKNILTKIKTIIADRKRVLETMKKTLTAE